MLKRVSYLILLSFIGFCTPLFAQDTRITGTPGSPEKNKSQENYQISLEQWEANERVKNNFNRLNTFPLYNNSDIQLDLGPAQFQITIPF